MAGGKASFLPADGQGRDAGRGVGFGASLQEAFDHTVAQLPGDGAVADQLMVYTLAEAGLVKGGIAGIHHYYGKITLQADGQTDGQADGQQAVGQAGGDAVGSI